MNVAINAKVLTDPILRGWNRYTINLISGLVDLGVKVFVYSNGPCDPAQRSQLPTPSVVFRQAPSMNYLLWEQVWLAQQCWSDQIDIFHSPIHFGLPYLIKAKCVLTLHDAIDELYDNYRERKPSLAQRRSRWLCKTARSRADHIITVSEYSRQDLLRCYRLASDRVSVTYEAADTRFHRHISLDEITRVRAKYALPASYLFYVGSLEQRKNLPFLLRALAAADIEQLHLIIGGGTGQEALPFLAQAADLGLDQRVRLLGHVDDADLPALYQQARAFVYPSEYEGFGLQLCEAMAVGCPVFASDATCLPEVLGDGGEIFSLACTMPLTEKIRRVQLDYYYRQELSGRALARSAHFSWEQTARKTLAVYLSLLQQNGIIKRPANRDKVAA